MPNSNDHLISSKLYIAEAAESKAKTEKEKEVVDPSTDKIKAFLDEQFQNGGQTE